ncbi:MAG: hypothetical protein HC805_00025 [Alkalinema sp. RL_2_19]|nr:hypothetical protein [Alkalinema sp. RL_2_19]
MGQLAANSGDIVYIDSAIIIYTIEGNSNYLTALVAIDDNDTGGET